MANDIFKTGVAPIDYQKMLAVEPVYDVSKVVDTMSTQLSKDISDISRLQEQIEERKQAAIDAQNKKLQEAQLISDFNNYQDGLNKTITGLEAQVGRPLNDDERIRVYSTFQKQLVDGLKSVGRKDLAGEALVKYDPKMLYSFDQDKIIAQAEAVAQEAKAKKTNPFRYWIGDTAVQAVTGLSDMLANVEDIAGSVTGSETLKNIAKGGYESNQAIRDALLSDRAKQDAKDAQEAMAKAEAEGSIVGQALSYLEDPTAIIGNLIGSGGGAGLAVKGATKLGTKAIAKGLVKEATVKKGGAIGFGGLQGGGSVTRNQRETAIQDALNAGYTQEEADVIGDKAAEFNAQQAIGMAIGGLAGSSGAESLLFKKASDNALKTILKDGGAEAVTEALQSGQEQYAGNVASIDQGLIADDQAMRGVAGAAAGGGFVGALGGGAFGGLNALTNRMPNTNVNEISVDGIDNPPAVPTEPTAPTAPIITPAQRVDLRASISEKGVDGSEQLNAMAKQAGLTPIEFANQLGIIAQDADGNVTTFTDTTPADIKKAVLSDGLSAIHKETTDTLNEINKIRASNPSTATSLNNEIEALNKDVPQAREFLVSAVTGSTNVPHWDSQYVSEGIDNIKSVNVLAKSTLADMNESVKALKELGAYNENQVVQPQSNIDTNTGEVIGQVQADTINMLQDTVAPKPINVTQDAGKVAVEKTPVDNTNYAEKGNAYEVALNDHVNNSTDGYSQPADVKKAIIVIKNAPIGGNQEVYNAVKLVESEFANRGIKLPKVNTTTAPDRFEIAKQLKSAIDNGKVESTDELQRMINVLSNPNVNAHSDLVRKKVMQDATALLGKVNNTNDVHDTEWNEYVANGKVTDERVQAIADKVISGKTPTAKESQMVGSDDANKRFEAILTAERAKSNNTDDNTAKNADGNLNDWIVATFTRPKNDDGKDDSKHKVDEIPDDKKKTITEQEAKDKVEQSKDKEQKDGSVKYDKAILLSEYEKLIAKQKQDEQDKKDATEQPTDAIATDTENTDTATVPDATPVPDTTIEPVMPETATPVAPTVNTASKAKLVEVTDKINAKKSESSNKRKAVAPTKKVEPKVAPAKDERSEGKKDVEITEDIVSDIEAGLIFAIVKSGDKYDYIDVRDGFNDEDFSDKSWKLSPLKNIDTIDEADRFFVTQDGLNKIIDIASSKVKKQPPISDSLDDISKFAGVDKLEISDNLIKDGLISYLTNKYPNANKDSSDVVLKSIYNQIESLKNGGTSTGLEKLIKRRNALNLISKKTTVTPTVKENTDSKTKVGKAVEKFAPNLVKKSTPKASKTPKKTTVKVEQVAEVAPIQIVAPTDTAVEQTKVENTARQNVDKAIEIIGTNDGNSILGDIINNKLDKEERDAIKNELEHENNLIIENDFGTPMKRSEFVNSKVIEELEKPVEITNESTLFQKVIAKIADFIANSVKSIGAIIMSVAIANGVVSNDANANPVNIDTIVQNQQITNDANVVNSFVTKNKDNNGTKYIIADKKAGVMYVMNADGSLAITTPALFGKDVGDNATSGQTPAGKFKLQVITTKQGDVYGGAVQGFTKGSFGEVYAIHRVITSNAKERRIARLNSKTANDNRVSNGCINVPAKFYDENLNGNFDGNVYIIPETTSIDAMFGGVLFSRRRKDNAKKGTVKMVEDALTSMFGVKDIKDLNNVNVIQSISEFGSASDIQKAVDNGQLSVIGEDVGENFNNVQGFYDPKTDKITMIAENLNSADDARAVFLHEVGHRSMKKTIGAEKWNRLHRMVSNWKDAKSGSIENEVYIKAKRSADASGETGDRLKDELIQYAVEEAYRAGIEPDAKVFNEKTVAGFMASVWRAFTNAMKKLYPSFKLYLSAQDLVNISYGIAKNDVFSINENSNKNELASVDKKNNSAQIVAQYATEDGAPTEIQIRIAQQQIRNIEKKYAKELADGSWVNLTPTGKPSELTKGQWVQVRTDNFKKWFGDWENDPDNASKVVNDVTGEPLVVYHGTKSDFNYFENSDGLFGDGIYLTDKYNQFAELYSSGDGGNIIPLFASIKNPEEYDQSVIDESIENETIDQVKESSNNSNKRLRMDGLIITNPRAIEDIEKAKESERYIVAGNSSQVKSAIGNIGTFEVGDYDIRFSMSRDEMLAYDGIAPKTKETILNSAKKKVGDSKDNLLKMAGAVVSKGDGLPKMTKLNMLLKGTRLLNEAWAFRVADMDSVVDWTKHLFNNLLAAYVRAIKTKGADVRAKIDDFHNAVGKYLSRADIKAQHDTLSELFVGATKENYDPSGTFKTKLGATKNAKLDALYNSLSEPAKQTYRNTLKFFRNQFNRELVAFEQSLRDAGHEDAYIDKLLSEIRKIEVYVPLRQYGNRVMSVYVRNADGSNGETLAHEFFDGKINIAFTEMRMKAEFKKMFGDNINVTQITEFREKLRPSLSASQNDVIDAHAARLRQNGLSEEEVDYQISEFVKTLSSFGIAKLEQTKQERTGIYSSGFKRDIFRAINDVVSANEMRIASLVHNKTITDAFNAAQEHIKKESLNPDYDGLSADMALKAIRESFDYRASNDGLQGLVTKVNGFGFLATMGFDASQIPLQLSSLMNLALPHLVARFPKDKAFATKQMGKNFYAVLKMVRYGGMTEYLNMLSDKASNGDTQAKKLFDSLKPAYEQMRANDRVSFTDLKEIENEIYGKTNLYSNILRYSGMQLNITEQVVNMTIAMTTIQLAEKNGMNQSEIDFQVDEALRRGNPNSTPTTKGLWAKSAMGRFVTIMRSYGMAVFARQMSDLRTVWRLKGTGSTEFKEARNRLVSTIVIQGTMAGAVGMPTFLTLPLWTMLFVAKAMTADDDEEELTTDQWTRKIFYETFGSDATRVMRYGMLSFIGGDALAKRMSFDDLIVRNTDDDLNGDGIRDYLDDLTANAPLTGGVSTRALGAFSKFVNDIEAGRPMDDVFDELFRKNLPMKSINSIAKAYDAIQNDGQVYSKDNTPLLSENNKLNPLEIGAMLLGIRPAMVMEAQNNKWELISAKMEKEQQKKAMLDNYKIVYAQFKQGIADQDDVDDAKEMIDEYNAKNPLYEISAKSIANAQKKLTVNMENSIITPRNKTDKARNESIFNNNPWLDSEEEF